MSSLRIPVSTYRVQFSLSFRFVDGRDLVPYLNDLGITDLYSSPRFKARRGSPHAYDVADPFRINSELGTEEEFVELALKLRNYGMGLLLDIVPNHMAASHENPWWLDVLENGVSSPYAHYFDVDWEQPGVKSAGQNMVLIPILGDLYGKVLENQELILRLDENGFFVRYYEHRLPIDPRSYSQIFEPCLDTMRRSLGGGHPAVEELGKLQEAVLHLPPNSTRDPTGIERRQRDSRNIKKILWALYNRSPEVKEALDETLRVFNGIRGEPKSFDLLDALLAGQAYRLAYWRMAAEEIDYRRFFDIGDLIGVRVEDPEVFDFRHREVFQLVHDGMVTGLRVDHIDGLYDPYEYLGRLQAMAAPQVQAAAGGAGGASGPLSPVETRPGFYAIAEKILGGEEELPEHWPVHGTTGYDYVNYLNGIFVDPGGLERLDQIYRRFTGCQETFAQVRYAQKKMAMRELFAGEVQALGQHLGRLAAQDRHARDLSFAEIVQAFVELSAWLPIYRTYIRDFEIPPRDARYIEGALAAAQEANGRINREVYDFLRRVLLLEIPHYVENRQDWLRFVMRWQQFTGPVMAKGYEDTACYVYNRLVSQNEVGSDPELADRPDLEDFHRRNEVRAGRWRYTLNATSTHDTKRSEDVRARINVLSEIPEEWARRLSRWSRWNAPKKTALNGAPAPDPNDEMLVYQTLVGAWPHCAEDVPAFRDRLKNYLQKAAREAKVHTSWTRPDEAYETALLRFADGILEESGENPFLKDFQVFQSKVSYYGAINALSQVLLKITSPGVPDFYQGTELWDLSLVDPDNRRPVDFTRRAQLLDELRRREAEDTKGLVAELVRRWTDGRIKLYVTYKALNLRRSRRELFLEGAYVPLYAAGERAVNVCSFARKNDRAWAITAAPRLLTRLGLTEKRLASSKPWTGTFLPLPEEAPSEWRNVFTGETVAAQGEERSLALADVFSRFPVALLEGKSTEFSQG